jgi:hypothetical protein
MTNKIILKAEGELEDKACRQELEKLLTKVETINERTKAHTIQIRELEKKIKNKEKAES